MTPAKKTTFLLWYSLVKVFICMFKPNCDMVLHFLILQYIREGKGELANIDNLPHLMTTYRISLKNGRGH